jgi:hypothetical protein
MARISGFQVLRDVPQPVNVTIDRRHRSNNR